MTKINLPATLKQYNLDTDKMSTDIKKKEVKNLAQNLSIKSLLQNLSIPVTKNNQTIILELLKHNLPLNQQLISDLNDFISNLKNNDALKTKIQIALLLKKINIPLNQKFYNFFKNYLFSKSDLKNNIKQLLDLLDYKNQNSFTKQKSNNLNNDQLPKQNNQIKQQIDNTIIKYSYNTNKDNLNSILQKLNLPLTKNNRNTIKKLINYKLKIDLNNFNKLSSLAPKNNETLMKLAFAEKLNLNNSKLLDQIKFSPNDKLIDSLIKLGKSLINSTTEQAKLRTKFKSLITKNPKLLLSLKKELPTENFTKLIDKLSWSDTKKESLLKQGIKTEIIETIITTNNLNSSTIKDSINKLNLTKDNQLVKFLFNLSQDTSSEQLKDKSEDLLKQLINLKVVNYETENTLLFLPVFFQKSLELAQIKINQEKDNNEENKEALKFSFKIETNKLDSIEVKIKIKNQKLNVLFITNNSNTKDLIQNNLELLKKSFEKQSFTINYADCRFQDEQENSEEESLSLTTIDFTI